MAMSQESLFEETTQFVVNIQQRRAQKAVLHNLSSSIFRHSQDPMGCQHFSPPAFWHSIHGYSVHSYSCLKQ